MNRAFTPTDRFYAVHLGAVLLPLAAGVIAFGWRAALLMLLVGAGATAGWAIWRRIGRRGMHVKLVHTLHLSLLLSALLPAQLAAMEVARSDGTMSVPGGWGLWPVLIAAGLALALMNWLVGGQGGGRVHASLAAYLLLAAVLGEAMTPTLALRRDAVVTGDVLDYRPAAPLETGTAPWIVRPRDRTSDALWQQPAARWLELYTTGIDRPERREVTLEGLLRDRLPPMEDLIVMGHPQPTGLASAAAVIAGGLLLIFRGVADARIPVMTIASAYGALLVLPVPAAITREGPVWTWLALLDGRVGWDVALTFVHYELLAGPLLFVAFFLAPLPSLRPLAGRWRVVWALLLGVAAAGSQLYVSVTWGPIVALLAVALLTPLMDRLTRARTLV